MKQRNGTMVENQYDLLNRLWKRTIQPGPGVEGTTAEDYQYDGLSRLVKAENNVSKVELEYDYLNRLLEEKQVLKVSENSEVEHLVAYSYENIANDRILRQTLQYPNQRVIERDFDLLNRLSHVREKGTQKAIVDYSYIGRSYRLLNQQNGNGDVVSYLYDNQRRVKGKEVRNKNSVLINQYVYGYNKVHMKMYEQRLHDQSRGDVFAYDDLYHLTGVKFDSPEPGNLLTDQFEKSWTAKFTDVDNVLQIIKEQNGQFTQINPVVEEEKHKQLNQYTRFDQWGMGYDENGNTTQKGTQRFYYDYRDQLVRATEGTVEASFKYDASLNTDHLTIDI